MKRQVMDVQLQLSFLPLLRINRFHSSLKLYWLHNHPARPSDNVLRELRNLLGDKCIKHSARSYSARTLYIESIIMLLLFSVKMLIINKSYYLDFIFYFCISHPEGATNYAFLQATEKMKNINLFFHLHLETCKIWIIYYY